MSSEGISRGLLDDGVPSELALRSIGEVPLAMTRGPSSGTELVVSLEETHG